ncbi:MAG: N-6 DNA methylase [Methylococcaceae bacterium]
MKRVHKNHNTVLNLPTLHLEGGLFLPDQLEKAALGKAGYQTEADYQIPTGLKLKDEYSRAFQIASAQWKHFAPNLERQDVDASDITIKFVQDLLRDALGYSGFELINGISIGERQYPITALAVQTIPIVIAPHSLGLDDADSRFAIVGSGARKKSAFQLAQEFLNASDQHLWALVSNGKQIRLLRDAATLTRPSFLEFDLQDMLDSGLRFAEFQIAWRLLHASRAGLTDECIWEKWRSEGQLEGTRVREHLRQGVTDALLTLGTGFIQHPANEILRRDLHEGRLTKDAYFQQLLRLVYRLIFLFTVEDRGILHSDDSDKQALAARKAYAEGYAMARLRDRCLRRRARDGFDDLWAGLRIVFRGLSNGEPRLALPALGGLFSEHQCPDLDSSTLSNANLLVVMQQMRWSNLSGNLSPVDYRNMGPEELGSVYESLLELVPEIDLITRHFGFVGLTSAGSTQGNARKTSGSYYTPDSLVQELIKSALDPVIEDRLASNPANPIAALLNIKVIDTSCGSGHFLLAAARRLAEKLAALRAPDGAVKPHDYRHALREVISHCIFGVDRNPMALELARMALWLEGFEEGVALSFLDHHLQCGDALIGLTDLNQLQYGIPDAAFKPLSGDDKSVCRDIAKANKEGLKAFVKHKSNRNLDIALHDAAGLAELEALEALPGLNTSDIAAKEIAYHAFLQHAKQSRLGNAANLLVGAFLIAKADAASQITTPTSQNLYLELFTKQAAEELTAVYQVQRLEMARQACEDARVLHWPLAFPQVYAKGGFDCVLGNPPWERIKLQEEEFFATRNRFVAEAKNKFERGQCIEWLAQGMLARNIYPELEYLPQECEAEQRLYQDFISARRTAEATSIFAHVKGKDGGRYPLTGVGDVNTYALFAETIIQITANTGRAGFIVPTGIATDDSTKAYFGHITQSGQLISMFDFENRDAIFPGVHRSYKFCLLTLGTAEQAEFSFFLTNTQQLADQRRRFALSADDFSRINPNTLTCPVFRSRMDAELTRKIYQRVPVLIREARSKEPEQNPWGIRFMTMFHMSNDSHLFQDSPAPDRLPLYEAKMIHQFDHRWASYRVEDGKDTTGDVALVDKQNPGFCVTPRYWISARSVYLRTANLPKGLLKALEENCTQLIILGITHLLFGRWLLQLDLSGPQLTISELYSTWKDFADFHPFAKKIPPTSLGLCGNNPACFKPLNDSYLPAEGLDSLKCSDRQSTAWYMADEKSVFTYLDFVSQYDVDVATIPSLKDDETVLVFAELLLKQATTKWLIGWRAIARATDERSVIGSIFPLSGVGNNCHLIFPSNEVKSNQIACLVVNISAIVFDFVARQKIGGANFNFFIPKQLPILPPDYYTKADFNFIVPRVLELTYTAHDLQPWAQDLGYDGPPFPFDPDRRAILRAELDAWYARAYGLTRDELRYILDPADIMGEDYPSETFRVLKNKELREFGEYRTQRLVLEAWDKMERGDLV